MKRLGTLLLAASCAGSAGAADCTASFQDPAGTGPTWSLGLDEAAACAAVGGPNFFTGWEVRSCSLTNGSLVASLHYPTDPPAQGVGVSVRQLPFGCTAAGISPETFAALGIDPVTIAKVTGWGFATVIFFWALGFPVGVAISAIRKA